MQFRLQDLLQPCGVLLADGAYGSMLMARGLPRGEPPERWNLTRPREVETLARGYADAGADLIKTNTFGGNRFRLACFGLEDEADHINETGAQLARRAAGPNRLVLGCIGPMGRPMDDDVAESELEGAFARQARALERGGADVILVETMSDPREAAAAVRAAKAATTCPVACTFTFLSDANGAYRTLGGATPEAAATVALKAGADALGANCMLGPADMVQLVREFAAAAPGVPLIIQPNAGQPVPGSGGLDYPESPEDFARAVPQFLDAGAAIIGGCCGTTPGHIRAMRRALDALSE